MKEQKKQHTLVIGLDIDRFVSTIADVINGAFEVKLFIGSMKKVLHSTHRSLYRRQ